MKARNMVVILICFVILFSLCACGTNMAEKKEEFASKEQFIEDMAKGLSNRHDHVDDSITRTPEEMAVYYQELVSLELEQIEKYESEVFEDYLFNELAHTYIDACQMQLFATQNHQNEHLRKLWLSAGTIRGAIVSEMYTNYNLPLSDMVLWAFDL